MKLRVTYRRAGGTATDLVLDVDGTTPVGALADVLQRADPYGGGASVPRPTLTVDGVAQPTTTFDADLTLNEAGLASGQFVAVAPAPTATASAAVLSVMGGPGAGTNVELRRGVNTIGRDRSCDVVLADPLVSKHHAKVIVGETVEIVDDNSSNGILLGGDQVQRVELRTGDVVMLGDTALTVQLRNPGGAAVGGGPVRFNRSPRVAPIYQGAELVAPEPPSPQAQQRFPIISLLAPLVLGGIMFAVTQSALSILFIALSPVMLVGGYFENRRSARKAFAEAVDLFRSNLTQLVAELRAHQDAERAGRCDEHPSTAEVVEAVRSLGPLVWTRRPEHEPFLELRLGLGMQLSRTEVELPNARSSPVALQQELQRSVAPYAVVDNVPIVARLAECGSIGVSGPEDVRGAIARSLVAQLVGLHSPAELQLAVLCSARSAPQWDWLKWLPHAGGDHSPLVSDPLVTTAPACSSLAAELKELIAARTSDDDDVVVSRLPALLVLVEDDAPVVRSDLVAVMESGREAGVHVMWCAASTALVPAAARTFLEVSPGTFGAATGKVIQAERVEPVVVESLDPATADWLARRLAPVVDAGAAADVASDVPPTVSFLGEAGSELASSTSAVVDRWTESNSLRPRGGPIVRSRRDNTLRALVGRTATDALHLDLRTQGPHALVGGTTGAGKSEFLQTWILGMATSHSPERVTFLFVDYKGGAAFADCVQLPHSVGLVTDLSPHLVQRALVSLRAELRHREHVLNRHRAKDLLELERRGEAECPPSLVIVVDEFAALVQEVPEFVDGVVDVAQRGRSLGLHLILATQRPAGVIKDNLRANTNLRIALRMADEEDSKDVVGIPLAGTFDPALPGRGVAKTGPGRLTLFQSGYVGGHTSDVPPPPTVGIATLVVGPAEAWEADVSGGRVVDDLGAPDIQRLVANVSSAAIEAGVDPPRRPWLPELAQLYDLATLPLARRDSELAWGVVDLPDAQSQETVAFRPDVDGNMAVYGTGGAGKSTFLRSLAISAGLTKRGGPCFVYALDFGSRGLTMLEALPHVGSVIGADDSERTARLISQLRDTIDERAVRYAAVNAASIDEYRRLADRPDEPRVLLLLDGFGAFRSAYEIGPPGGVYDTLLAIAADGRPVGVHLVLSADRLGAVPTSLSSSVQRRLALRVTGDVDQGALGVPRSGFPEGTPPGRGFLDRAEVQVAVFGGTGDVAAQATAVGSLAASMQRAGATPAPAIERLPERVLLEGLPVHHDGLPTFALADSSLGPIGFDPSGSFLVAGPSASGRTTVVRSLLHALRRSDRLRQVIYFGHRRSPLAAEAWEHRAVGPEAAAGLAERLAADLTVPGADVGGAVVVIDGIGEFVNSEADFALQELLKVCRSHGLLVIADGETSDVVGSWPLLQQVKAARHGIVLQPDQMDGDTLFRTTFPRMARSEFPPGRGVYVRNGRPHRVQVALPPDAA